MKNQKLKRSLRLVYDSKNQKSFSLIEILIVIGIIVVLIGIGFPIFKSLQPSIQLNGAIRNLVADIHYAQQLTITEQVKYCLRLFPSEKKYQIIQCGEEQPLSEVFFSDEIITLTTIGFINNEIEFNPYGAVKKSGNITLENSKNRIKTIEVRPSGFIKISD